MPAVTPEVAVPANYEIAAGGLVWSSGGPVSKIAVVRRTKHNDCTLPKGRPASGERIEVTALREAQEETGFVLKREEFLGSYAYVKNDRPKVVLIWRMVATSEKYRDAATPEEIAGPVEWMEPADAIALLSHTAEKEFVERVSRNPVAVVGTESHRSPKVARLAAAVASVRRRLKGNWPSAEMPPLWVIAAKEALDRADQLLRRPRVDLDGAWAAVHDAERLMVLGLDDAGLLTLAVNLEQEAKTKLHNWRASAADSLFRAIDPAKRLKDARELENFERDAARNAVIAALQHLHEDSDNRYHRLRLVARQLSYLVLVLAGLLLTVGLIAWSFGSGTPWSVARLVPVALAGAFGAVVTSMFQLSRLGEAKVPEALMQGLITSGRPVVGAACALFIYSVLQSGLLKLVPEAAGVDTPTILVFAFVAGFSEKFVLGAVAKITGGQDGKKNA